MQSVDDAMAKYDESIKTQKAAQKEEADAPRVEGDRLRFWIEQQRTIKEIMEDELKRDPKELTWQERHNVVEATNAHILLFNKIHAQICNDPEVHQKALALIAERGLPLALIWDGFLEEIRVSPIFDCSDIPILNDNSKSYEEKRYVYQLLTKRCQSTLITDGPFAGMLLYIRSSILTGTFYHPILTVEYRSSWNWYDKGALYKMVTGKIIRNEENNSVDGIEFSCKHWKISYLVPVSKTELEAFYVKIQNGTDSVLNLGEDSNTSNAITYSSGTIKLEAARYGGHNNHAVEVIAWDINEFLLCLKKLIDELV